MTSRSRCLLLLSSTLTALPLLLAAPAHAQESEGEEIIITGSLVSRSDANSPSPISLFDSEDLIDAGNVSISEMLRKDPALGSASRGPQNSLNGAGSIGVNLRNLGNRRSLVLINGKRYPIFTDSIYNTVQDIGAIPAAMIEQVDVLRDGASTTYGADAVAGVVNFRLRTKFDGLQVEAFNGISSRGDGASHRISAIVGASSDRGDVVLAAQWEKQDDIPQDARPWATNLVTSLLGTGTINGLISPGGPVYGATGATPIACYPVGGGTTNLAPNCESYDSSHQSSLILGREVRSIAGSGRYELTNTIQFNASAFYSDRSSNQDISSTQINTASAVGVYRNILIPGTNSNNPYGRDVFLRWRPTTYGPRTSTGEASTFWGSIGFSGEIFGRFKWDVSHTYGQTKSTVTSANTPLSTSLYNLLNPTACAADPVCRPIGAIPNIAALLQGTTPLTGAQRDYLFYDQISNSKYTSQQTRATIQGSLFRLPGGDVKLALGAEYRQETGKARSDEITQSQVPIGSYIFPTNGEFSTKEVFGELDLPLLADAPFVHELSVNLQARYSDFSTFGGADTYKAGIVYAPIDGLRFRASYGTSFRAPDIIELFGGGFGGLGSGTDPCNSAAGGLRATNATVAANCTALGVPTVYTQPATTIPIRSGGNPMLNPERGETYTIGAVLTPRFAPGLSISVDYFNVKVKDAITAVSGFLTNQLNDCYSSSDFAARAANSNDICFGYGDRSANGDLLRVNAGSLNLQELSTSGVDFSLTYATEPDVLVPGSLTLDLRGSYLDSFNQAGREYVGQFVGGIAGDTSYPRWRGVSSLSYAIDTFTVRWTANFVNAMQDSSYGTTVPVTNFLNYSGVPSYWSHDLLFKVADVKGLDFTVGVNNLFDKDPPYAFVSTRNTLPSTYDQIGRYFFMAVRAKF